MTIRVPILRQGTKLIASIQEELSDSDIMELQTNILEQLIKTGATGVIVDVSAVEVLDSFGTRTLSEIAAAIRLRGAKMAIVGIQPEVAFSMVLLGLTLHDVPTALDLDRGLALLEAA